MLKYNKNKGKEKPGKKHKRRKKNERRKKKEKKGEATQFRTGDLAIARRAPYLLRYVRHYNKLVEIYVIYKSACTSSLIRKYRQTDGRTGYEADSHNNTITHARPTAGTSLKMQTVLIILAFFLRDFDRNFT